MASDVSRNCLYCAFGTAFKYTHISGISNIMFTCNHANNAVVRITEPIFFKLKAIPAIISLIIICISAYFGAMRQYKDFTNNPLIFNQLLNGCELLLYGLSFTLIMQCLFKNSKMDNVLMCFDSAIKVFEAQTSHCLLSIDDIKLIRSVTYIFVMMLCVLISLLAVLLFLFKIDPNWSLIEKLGILISLYVLVTTYCLVYIFVGTFYYAHNKYNNCLKTDFENLFCEETTCDIPNVNCCIIPLPRENIKDLLKGYCDAYMAFAKTIKACYDSISPLALILLTTNVGYLIIFAFLIILLVAHQHPITFKFVIIEIMLLNTIGSTAYASSQMARCNTINSEILKLLKKFTFCKLNVADNLQFEIFLYVAKTYPTKIFLSDILLTDLTLFRNVNILIFII